MELVCKLARPSVEKQKDFEELLEFTIPHSKEVAVSVVKSKDEDDYNDVSPPLHGFIIEAQ